MNALPIVTTETDDLMARHGALVTACRFIARVLRVAAAVTGVAATLALYVPLQAAEAAGIAEPPRGNAVTHWNAVALDAFGPTQGTNPMAQSRTLAILHASIHDALNAIDGRFEPYTAGLPPAPGLRSSRT